MVGNTTFEKQDKEILNNVLTSGVWGTIGPEFIKSCKYIAEYRDNKHGLLTFSYTAALEALLRSLEIGYGDEVITSSYGNPINSMTISAIGATPVFIDIEYETGTISIERLAPYITDKTKAVIVDQIAGNACDIEMVKNICTERNIFLIENASDGFKTTFKDIQTSKYSDASVFDLSTPAGLDLGMGGAILTDNEDIFQSSYAYHNCGRHFGEYNNLKVDFILGGNMRITEWQSALIRNRLNLLNLKTEDHKINELKTVSTLECGYLIPLKKIEYSSSFPSSVVFIYNESKNGYISKDNVVKDIQAKGFKLINGFKAMHRQPFFTTEYFKKITGHTRGYNDSDLESSIKAEQNYIWVSIENSSEG